jgi:putative endopeptidase
MKNILYCGAILVGMTTATAQVKMPKSAGKTPGINLEAMDKNVKPSEDFFKFVNGTWLQKTEIRQNPLGQF